jgi:hypothetical protein
VEGFLVRGHGVRVEGRGVRVAERGEQLGTRLDEVEVVAVALLRFVSLGAVVGRLRGCAVPDQVGVLTLEEVELAADDVGKSPPSDQRSSP